MKCNLRQHSEQRFCCGGCGRAFSSMIAFDAHRATDATTDQRICLDPAELFDKQGNRRFMTRTIKGRIGVVDIWGTAGEMPKFWEAS